MFKARGAEWWVGAGHYILSSSHEADVYEIWKKSGFDGRLESFDYLLPKL